jgi:hypothetical protein
MLCKSHSRLFPRYFLKEGMAIRGMCQPKIITIYQILAKV